MNFNERREEKVAEIENVLKKYLPIRRDIRKRSWKRWNITSWREEKEFVRC